ncbi:MAG: ADP-ribosylglycohydrolase family protein [Planctomycetaceae bacterium]
MNSSDINGCLIGTAVGDALGLPYEGLSARRAMKVFGPPTRHRLLFRRGMVSDDTEHTLIVAESLIESGGDTKRFERAFAKRLRRWFLSLPAGMGMATAKACLKLLVGVSAKRSGVFSAGNGPAMRSAILGVFADDIQQLSEFVRITTRITHTDPKAEMGAFAIALAAHLAKSGRLIKPQEYLSQLREHLPPDGSAEFLTVMERATEYAEKGCDTKDLASDMGLVKGVGGFVYHCVPVAVHCWLSHQTDFRAAMETIISCGGDTDTNAAMVGGIIGASSAGDSIPVEWIDSLILYPMSIESIGKLAQELNNTRESGEAGAPKSPLWVSTFARNVFFLAVVLFHGFRRLLPPY